MTEAAVLNKPGVQKLLAGRLWFGKRDFQKVPDLAPGEIARVLTPEGQFGGLAYFNPKSSILARLLSREETEIGEEFFINRFQRALSLRQKVYRGEGCFRLVHAEGDLLPGLTIDIYGDVAVIEITTAGMERQKDNILKALKAVIPLRGFVLRNDLPVRKEEGLDLYVEAEGVKEPLEVTMDGLRFLLRPLTGQKTGFFLDQRENRRRLARYVAGETVLDLFCYTGAFSFYAARAGAKKVLAVDRSQEALALAEETARLNGLKDRIVFVCDEVTHFLSYAPLAGVVVLDPPAFIKKKRAYFQGLKRYRELISLAQRRVTEGGLLLACSCSQFLRLEEFERLAREELVRAGRQPQLLEVGLQAPDHPVYLPMPETWYLKALFLRLLFDIPGSGEP